MGYEKNRIGAKLLGYLCTFHHSFFCNFTALVHLLLLLCNVGLLSQWSIGIILFGGGCVRVRPPNAQSTTF